jgi:predicted phosphodiesterase
LLLFRSRSSTGAFPRGCVVWRGFWTGRSARCLRASAVRSDRSVLKHIRELLLSRVESGVHFEGAGTGSALNLGSLLGLIYDVHGNLPALEAVLEDADGAGVERYLLGGDYTLFGAWPRDTIARLRELDADWIRGNGERWTASPDDAPDQVQAAIARCRELLGDDLVAELAELPETLDRGDTLYCHGSPGSDVASFFPEPADDEGELLDGVEARRLVFGHTHLAFAREARGIELVNPGSVGMPFDGDTRAAWALVRDDGSVEHRRVAYDHQASAAAVRKTLGGDAGDLVARRIEQARFDPE